MNSPEEIVARMEPVEKKPRLLRLSNKSAGDIDPDIREEMVEELMDRPDAESLTRMFGSTLVQVIFSVLWVLALRQRRIERLVGKSRDGYGNPRVTEIDAQRRPARAASREYLAAGEAA